MILVEKEKEKEFLILLDKTAQYTLDKLKGGKKEFTGNEFEGDKPIIELAAEAIIWCINNGYI
jgi:hypothetical protein